MSVVSELFPVYVTRLCWQCCHHAFLTYWYRRSGRNGNDRSVDNANSALRIGGRLMNYGTWDMLITLSYITLPEDLQALLNRTVGLRSGRKFGWGDWKRGSRKRDTRIHVRETREWLWSFNVNAIFICIYKLYFRSCRLVNILFLDVLIDIIRWRRWGSWTLPNWIVLMTANVQRNCSIHLTREIYLRCQCTSF